MPLLNDLQEALLLIGPLAVVAGGVILATLILISLLATIVNYFLSQE
jgi:hypothetical protein